jgi:hypothetical protein
MVFKIGINLNKDYEKKVTIDDVYFKDLLLSVWEARVPLTTSSGISIGVPSN